ncbi:MAG: adenylate/guanylate cyclase domain-containing protein [Verrucomicrobiota bacterium]|nr:adenylate/guanylate cyclase domain-containing protein [Verrucomicrobiota bacterium]
MSEERRLAAIMFADVCDFSRVIGEDEKRALAIVDMAVSCIQSGADEFGGRTIKKLGDGVLVEFASAVNAVRCAMAVQQAICRHNARSSPKEQFHIRIGIHVGDVVVSEGDILGDGVNVASRIEPLAEPGGICISRDVFDMVRNKVDIEAVHLGPCELKNISRQVDIYRILLDAVSSRGVADTLPPPLTAARPRRAKTWMIAASVVGALLILAAAGAANKRRLAKAAFENVSEQARRAVDQGKSEEALRILQSYPAEFRKTSFQARVDEDIERAQDRVAQDAARKRQKELFLAARRNDRDAVLEMIDPAALKKVDRTAASDRLALAAGILRLAKVDADGLSIDSVELSSDRLRANVHMRVRAQNPQNPAAAWKPVPPAEWRQIDGSWRFVPQWEGGESRPPGWHGHDNGEPRPPKRR